MTVKEKSRRKRERETLRAFNRATKKAGMWPELREVAAELGVCTAHAENLLKALVAIGELEKVGRYRGYRLAKKAPLRAARAKKAA